MDEQGRRKSIRMTILLVAVSTVSLGICIAILLGRTYTLSWGGTINSRDSYVFIEDQTLTQEDLDLIASLSNLEYLQLKNCNVAECRLPELTFRSKRLRELDLTGTEGLWDLSFLSNLTVESLTLDNCKGIDDLSVLNLSELDDLSINGTDVTDLSPLAGSNISSLSFAHTEVRDLTPLAAMDGLWSVDGSYTQVSSIDVLAGIDGISCLRFNGCPIKEVTASFASTHISELELAHTQVRDLGVLNGCVSLRELNLAGCAELKDLSWLGRETYRRLRVLDLSGTSFTREDLAWISSCTSLNELSLNGIELGDLSLCAPLKELTRLSVVGCGITDISALKGLHELDTLLLGYNQIQDLSYIPRPQEEWASLEVDLSHNGLATLRGLPAGEYRVLFLQGNDPDIGRTLPSGVSAYEIVVPWFSGIDDTRLANYDAVSRLYLIDCPAEKQEDLANLLGSWHVTFLSEEGLWDLLEGEGLDYELYADMSEYVAYAREQAASA